LVTDMTAAFAVLLVVHGLIHLLGVVKAFGLAPVPQLVQPVSPLLGLLWLAPALLFPIAAVALFAWPRVWWIVGACAVAASMAAIMTSWSDARAGMLVNAVVLVGVVYGFFFQGPSSLGAEYARDVEERLSAQGSERPIAEADLEHLPVPVQRYLRIAGAIGQPRIWNFRVRMHGRIRGSRNDRWMPLTAEQLNFLDPPARLFSFHSSMFGVPVQGYHRYAGAAATMRVKAAALVPVVAAAGREMTQSETVTLFNDLCIMAPAALIDRAILWEVVDSRTVRARYSNSGYTIQAELTFGESGELANFTSDDRYQVSGDGRTARRLRWSTPVSGYRSFGRMYLPSIGIGRWHDSEGVYDYLQITIEDVSYNVRAK
jgi:hypothetical protein